MRKIVFVTDTRAEYGVLKNTLKKINRSDKLELYIIVTGAHLSERYGATVHEIEMDGFSIAERIPTLTDDNDNIRIPIEMGNLMSQLARAFEKIEPDILLLFGDRYEMLAAASTAVGMHIPIAHISGGEITQGAMDEQIRHAITKMAHIHFPGAEAYAQNIRNMGEESWRVYNVGDPAIENIKNVKLWSKARLEQDLKIKIDKRTLLVTYHPVTLERERLEEQLDNLIIVLQKHDGTKIITYPNSDDGGGTIIKKLQDYAKRDPSVRLIQSLGIVRYLSVMYYCGAVVGNSSSAIVEAPFLKVPAVNIGNRQQGRLMAESIICCDNTSCAIQEAIEEALSESFHNVVSHSKSLYGEGNTSSEIVNILENIVIDESLLKKKLEWATV